MDQGRQAGDALDAAVVSSVPGKRSAAATERPGLRPREPVSAGGVAQTDSQLVGDEFAAAAREDRRTAREACALLLVALGRGTSPSPAVRRHAAPDLGAAGARRMAGERMAATLAKKQGQEMRCRQSVTGT